MKYGIIQEGGTSREHYIHTFDSIKEAQAYKRSAEKASYETSNPFPLDEELANSSAFFNAVEDIISAIHETMP